MSRADGILEKLEAKDFKLKIGHVVLIKRGSQKNKKGKITAIDEPTDEFPERQYKITVKGKKPVFLDRDDFVPE